MFNGNTHYVYGHVQQPWLCQSLPEGILIISSDYPQIVHRLSTYQTHINHIYEPYINNISIIYHISSIHCLELLDIPTLGRSQASAPDEPWKPGQQDSRMQFPMSIKYNGIYNDIWDHISSYIIIYHHISSYIIIYHQLWIVNPTHSIT